jgi:hypothetical protein
MNKQLLDLYTDYLLSSFGATTATGLSELVQGEISHDEITRFLKSERASGKQLWQYVKPFVRTIEREDGVLIIDDSIEEKPYTDENAIICWHWDHCKNRQVKGLNFVSALYHSQSVSVPVGFEIVAKTEQYIDEKTGHAQRRSPVTKNEMARQLIRHAVENQLPFTYVLADIWFAAAETMNWIKRDLAKELIFALKDNRKVALSLEDKNNGRYQRIDALTMPDNSTQIVFLEGLAFPLLLVKQLFTNEDGSTGLRYLISSDILLDFDQATTLFQKRWKVELYHRSLKQNAALAKSPTRTVTTQTNHFFASLCAFVKLESLALASKRNHYALKSSLYIRALRSAFDELTFLKNAFPHVSFA